MTDPVIAAAEALVAYEWDRSTHLADLREKDRAHYLAYGRVTAGAALGALGLHVPMFPAQTSDGPAARMAYLLAEADALIVLRRDTDARMAALIAEAWALCAEAEGLLP